MNRNSSLLDLFDSDNEGNSSGSKRENIIEDNGNLIKLKLPKYNLYYIRKMGFIPSFYTVFKISKDEVKVSATGG